MALDNFIPKNDMAECNRCKKYRGEFVCEKFPEWIPRQKPVGMCPDFEPKETMEDKSPEA